MRLTPPRRGPFGRDNTGAAPGSRYATRQDPTTTGPLPLVFGTSRVSGKYVTLWDRLEPEQDANALMRPATYTARIALCQGPATSYRRIWIDGKLVPSATNPGRVQGLFSYHNEQSATYIDPATYGEEAAKLSLLGPFADRSFAFVSGNYAEGDWTYQSPRPITGYWGAPTWNPPQDGNPGYYDDPVWNPGSTTAHVWPRDIANDPRPPLGGVTHLRVTRLQATSGDSPPKVDVEVLGLHRSGLTGAGAPLADDANPADVLTTLLTSAVYSWAPLLSASELEVDVGADGTAASSCRRYCQARGFYVSRTIDAYTPILDLVAELLQACNCIAFWSEGKLKVRPLGDRAVTGYGVTYTPVTTATTLTTALGDFVGDAESLVTSSRTGDRDVRNVVALTYRRRDNLAHIYGEETSEAAIRFDASVRGLTSAEDVSNGWISREAHAASIAHLLAYENVTRRTAYSFRLGPRHQALEPGDFVTLTEPVFGLDSVLCRVAETVENDGYIDVVADEWADLPVTALALTPRPTPSDGAELRRDTGQDALAVAVSKPVNIRAAVTPTTREDGSALVAGDTWTDSDDNNHSHIWAGGAWVSTRDGTISTAQSTADGKNRTFVQASAPTAYAVGDLWYDSDDGNRVYRWSGSAWVALPVGTGAIDDGAVTTPKIPPEGVDWNRISGGQANTDNLWPNPTSELAPPAGADTTSPEWANRVASADAYSGGYVRELSSGGYVNLWVPCSPGDGFYIQAAAKRTTAGTGCYVGIRFYQSDKTTACGGYTLSTAAGAAWEIISARANAPATTGSTGAAWCRLILHCPDCAGHFDAIYVRRVLTADIIAANAILVTHLSAGVTQTRDYAVDSNGNPTAGAAMLTAPNDAPDWSSGTTYGVGAVVLSSGVIYRSLQASNTNHTPASSPTWWAVFAPLRVAPSGIQIGKRTVAQSFLDQLVVSYGTLSIASGGSLSWSGVDELGTPSVSRVLIRTGLYGVEFRFSNPSDLGSLDTFIPGPPSFATNDAYFGYALVPVSLSAVSGWYTVDCGIRNVAGGAWVDPNAIGSGGLAFNILYFRKHPNVG